MQRLYGTVTDASGNAVPYSQVSVLDAALGTLVTIYNPYEGDVPSHAIGNPMTADPTGFWICAVPSGKYTLSINLTNGAVRTIPFLNV